MSDTASKPKTATYSPELQALVVPGERYTLNKLVRDIAERMDRQKLTAYSLSRRVERQFGVPMTADPVYRLVKGYAAAGEGVRGRVNDPDAPGRIRLDKFLLIVQALGFDVELVAREAPARA